MSFKWSLNRTPIFEYLMTWFVAKNGHQKDICYNKFGLCITPDSIQWPDLSVELELGSAHNWVT